MNIEYYSVFYKDNNLTKQKKNIQNRFFLLIGFTAILIYVQFLVLILLIITMLMLLRLYIVQRSITHLVMFFTITSGMLSLISTLLDNIPITGAWELSHVGNIITVTFLLTTSLAGPIEDRIRKSEKRFRDAFNRAEFYKDLFAHDISNILQSVKTSLELASHWRSSDEKREEIDKLLNIMDEQVIRGSNLITIIRKFSQVEEGILDLTKVNLIRCLNVSIKFVIENYPKKKIGIQKNYDTEELYVNANDLLLDVFENILMSMVKHNDKSEIEILIDLLKTLKNKTSFIKIELKDNGMGIPNDMKEAIFKTGIRNREKVKGMGLGLILAKQIINSYNGEIWVEDKIKGDYTKGSNFIILIPEVV
ncbi:MAG: sensor histidine kinase [Promethearchaeota archaeon]